ncbi:MAG TPA: glutamate 5-kinase [Woeseiaceae bacterium]|nr:glutamate 5-kinase [Woeseiaceae bacterium]
MPEAPASASLFREGSFRRLVIKIGSSLLTDGSGAVNRPWLSGIAEDITALRARDCGVLVVTSGAIAIGCRAIGINRRRARLEMLQAAAACGQVQLMQAYQEALGRHGIAVAQVLLTLDDTEHRRRFLNARGTLEKLLEHDVVPVINENDTVATDEIRYGDNDRLAARVAQMVMADGLLLLSDIDGLYTSDPRENPDAEHVAGIGDISDDVIAMAGGPRSADGSGGMATKLQAAQIATHAGCRTIIANGNGPRPVLALASGARCTMFRAQGTPASVRQQWLAGALRTRGALHLDAGAVAALQEGSSLLPVGVTGVTGDFARGDPVALLNGDGREIGRGLIAYESSEAARIIGCHSDELEARLGYRGRSVMIHRNDLVFFGRTK